MDFNIPLPNFTWLHVATFPLSFVVAVELTFTFTSEVGSRKFNTLAFYSSKLSLVNYTGLCIFLNKIVGNTYKRWYKINLIIFPKFSNVVKKDGYKFKGSME